MEERKKRTEREGEGERGVLGQWTEKEKEQEIQFSLYLYA